MNPFEGMGLHTVEAVDYYNRLNCTTLDLQDAGRFSKLKDTLSYIGELPDNQRSLFLRRALKSNPEDSLDMAWQFSQLHIQRDNTAQTLAEKTTELDAYRKQFETEGLEALENEEARKIIGERQEIQSSIDLIDSEINLFTA